MSRMITVDELFAEDFEPAWLVRERRDIKDIQDKFLTFAFTLRYDNVETCFKCNSSKKFVLMGNRKAFSCQWCGKQIYPLAGTALHKSATPVKKWLGMATLLKDPTTTAMHLCRQFKVTYKTAWRIKNIILDDFSRRGILYAFIYEDLNINDELLVHYKFAFMNKRD